MGVALVYGSLNSTKSREVDRGLDEGPKQVPGPACASQEDLAKRGRVAKQTLVDFERGARSPYPRTLGDIREALEAAGARLSPLQMKGALLVADHLDPPRLGCQHRAPVSS
jgi:hypothetical protein